MAIRPGGTGDVTESNVVWTNPRGGPFVPSAILVGERYYLVDDAGIATCLNARDGKSLWQKRLPGRYTASPVAGDGKIYFTNEDGVTVVISATENKYREVARNDVKEPVFASLALSQGRVFLRTSKQLLCIGAVASP
jgi:outer membrane protein assembly factor BamB